MSAVKVCLHRGKGTVSKLIQWQTRSEYSHASILLVDGTLLESVEGKGVINSRRLDDVRRTEQVDVFDVTCTISQAARVIRFALDQLGKDYDYRMVARFVSRRGEDRSATGRWFCSELVFAAFCEAEIALLERSEPWEVSPGLLARSPLLREVRE